MPWAPLRAIGQSMPSQLAKKRTRYEAEQIDSSEKECKGNTININKGLSIVVASSNYKTITIINWCAINKYTDFDLPR